MGKHFFYTVVQQAVSEVITKEVSSRIDSLEKRIDDLEKRFEVRFDNIEKSLATVQGNLEGEARFFHLAEYLKKASQA